ncbi:MAG TPA: Uma2 family endonuclease [Thiolinea sp.]|nr:Uma2 family endonuclease [Thiolinea sp.]
MTEPAKRFVVYEDLWNLPENITGEILYGQVHTQPRPAPRHALATSSLGDELVGPFQKGRQGGPGGWWILDEPELHLGVDILVPDLAGWRKERMPELPETAWFELAPDWVCEVLSPATAQKDRSLKMPLYARHGVGHVWLIDPDVRTLEAYVLENRRWVLLGVWREDQQAKIPPFDAVELLVGALWG